MIVRKSVSGYPLVKRSVTVSAIGAATNLAPDVVTQTSTPGDSPDMARGMAPAEPATVTVNVPVSKMPMSTGAKVGIGIGAAGILGLILYAIFGGKR